MDENNVVAIISGLVTDRTVWDVVERTEKGFYSIDDLNRVETAVAALAQYMTYCGYPVSTVTLEWTYLTSEGFPNKNNAARYLGNIRAIRAATPASDSPDMPDVPANLDMLTFREANDIEIILCKTFEYVSAHENKTDP